MNIYKNPQQNTDNANPAIYKIDAIFNNQWHMFQEYKLF